MSIAKLILLIVVLGALVVFALENWLPAVPLVILGGSTIALPLAVWILGAIAAGAVTTLVVTLLLRLGGGGNVPSRRRPPVRPTGDRTEPMASGKADRFQWATRPFAAFNRKPTAERAAARGTAANDPRPRRPADSWESFSRPRVEWEDWQRYEEPGPARSDRPPNPHPTPPPTPPAAAPEFAPDMPPETSPPIRDRDDRAWEDWEGYEDYFESRGEDRRPMGDRAADYYREAAPEEEFIDREEFDDRRRDRQYGHHWEETGRTRTPDWQPPPADTEPVRNDGDYGARYAAYTAPEPPLESELVDEEVGYQDYQDYQDYIVDYGDEDEIDRYDRELEERTAYADDFEEFDDIPPTPPGQPQAEEPPSPQAGQPPQADDEPHRPIREVQREPKTVSQSGSLYSYSYRRPEATDVDAEPAAADAEPREYRVLTPPYRPDSDDPSDPPPTDSSPADSSPP